MPQCLSDTKVGINRVYNCKKWNARFTPSSSIWVLPFVSFAYENEKYNFLLHKSWGQDCILDFSLNNYWNFYYIIISFPSRWNISPYLNNFKVNNFHDSTTEHGVSTIFSTMAHGVKATITRPYQIISFGQLPHQIWAIGLPIPENSWEKKFLLVIIISSSCICWQSHVPKN